jgi:hypothetical protein
MMKSNFAPKAFTPSKRFFNATGYFSPAMDNWMRRAVYAVALRPLIITQLQTDKG